TYHLVTLGCPKNEVDSDKLVGLLTKDGMTSTERPQDADLIIVNTCAFIEEARQESIDTVLEVAGLKQDGARLVVTGCMAERYGGELSEALPEVDQVSGFGVPVTLNARSNTKNVELPTFDLLNLPRPKSDRPWAYVKIAEGCDRSCGFCAIPAFRGPQRSRTIDSILEEINELEAREIVLVAQDLASFGRDQGQGEKNIVPLIRQVNEMVERVRLLYLYPSDLNDDLIEAILSTNVPYFDLSLQHVSRSLLRRMRRWGDGKRFSDQISAIRDREPDAVFRSNFIVGYPGETEEDHEALLNFLEISQIDWCGFFPYSPEEGTYAETLEGLVESSIVTERLSELTEIQDQITAKHRDKLIGQNIEVLVDEAGIGRSWREAPEIDGVVNVPEDLPVGELASVTVSGATGPDLETHENF
ncbi:MAG TPA: 30S ribosomal protein S12 methylthiotransferase RimO, partial [Acidimicrobiales bacterium]|nr:30S ribosomal protein S12 methylthiotransferase RimO [Acidimicrobiales bacterium]